MKPIHAAALAASMTALLSAGAARATSTTSTVLYNNLGAMTEGSEGYSPVFGDGPLADSFSTGASAVTLDTVSVLLQAVATDPPEDYATVSLLADDGMHPGASIAMLGTVMDSDLNATPSLFSFSGGQVLAANTRYWIQIAGTDTSIGSWNNALGDSGMGVAGEYYADAFGSFSNTDTGELEGPYQMQVTADPGGAVSAAPEPSSWALLLAGVAGVGVALRQARRRGLFVKDVALA